ncbi:hypothetical protein L4C34_15645 [Vibrio profundum]|uniref:hypothetical protein n=1 Tax=Vibrio profundum TaxID=2910247 RepID=UPI003D0E4E52
MWGENCVSDDIIIATKRLVKCQVAFGAVAMLYEVFFSTARGRNIESALIGVLLAIVPSLIGMLLASYKATLRSNKSVKDLIQLSRNAKLIYTVVFFGLVFHFMVIRNVVVIISYCITFLGCFISPFWYQQDRVK